MYIWTKENYKSPLNSYNYLTETIRNAGYFVVSEPRYTGDGYYESCILDPDENRI